MINEFLKDWYFPHFTDQKRLVYSYFPASPLFTRIFAVPTRMKGRITEIFLKSVQSYQEKQEKCAVPSGNLPSK